MPASVIIPLGRELMIVSSEIRKSNGVVYTPLYLAQYIAEKLVRYYSATSQASLKNVTIIDPACGDGELLVAIQNVFNNGLVTNEKHGISNSATSLYGVDIDQNTISLAKKRIGSLLAQDTITRKLNFLSTNSLCPFNMNPTVGWERVKKRFGIQDGFDMLIANPPWGAATSAYQQYLSIDDYSLYRGQFDTSDLFIELASHIVKPSGYFAYIIPDSLFSFERTELRKMLLGKFEINFIGRFGEKIFENVNRGCAVIIGRNIKASEEHLIDCFQLTPQFRKRILSGISTFFDAEEKLQHSIPQNRFMKNKDHVFNIYLHANEQITLDKINSCKHTFRDYLSNSRGVELSKRGKVCQCNYCFMWLPYPTSNNPKCPHCKSELVLSNIETDSIVKNDRSEGYEPIIVGENVKRYYITPTYWINPNKKGINYKDSSIYNRNKIVVRKTGVGLLAAMDYDKRMTNQVVYIFSLRNGENANLPLELFIAIMNSRMAYYYLVKTYGETEWRSHPYLTQKQILDLPIPIPHLSNGLLSETIIPTINELKPFLLSHSELSADIDARVENMVARLYGLSKDDYKHIFNTLDDVEALIPIKYLKTISINSIF